MGKMVDDILRGRSHRTNFCIKKKKRLSLKTLSKSGISFSLRSGFRILCHSQNAAKDERQKCNVQQCLSSACIEKLLKTFRIQKYKV